MNTTLLILSLLGIGILLLGWWMYRNRENFTTNGFAVGITWQPPIQNGGDPNCCGYKWAVCQGSSCDPTDTSTVIKSGTSSSGTAGFWLDVPTDVQYNTQYTAVIQATNVTGDGPWTPITFTTPIQTSTLIEIATGTVDYSSVSNLPQSFSDVPGPSAGNDTFVIFLHFQVPDGATSISLQNPPSISFSVARDSDTYTIDSTTLANLTYSPTSADFAVYVSLSNLADANNNEPPTDTYSVGDIVTYSMNNGMLVDNNGATYPFDVTDNVTLVGTTPGAVTGLKVGNVITPPK